MKTTDWLRQSPPPRCRSWPVPPPLKSSTMAECEFSAFGSAEASVESNGCEFVFHPGTGSRRVHRHVRHLLPGGSNKIVVTGGGCEAQIGAQTGLGPVAYENGTETEPDAVVADFQMDGGPRASPTRRPPTRAPVRCRASARKPTA